MRISEVKSKRRLELDAATKLEVTRHAPRIRVVLLAGTRKPDSDMYILVHLHVLTTDNTSALYHQPAARISRKYSSRVAQPVLDQGTSISPSS